MYSLRSGKVSVIATLTAIYPVIAIFLAAVILKERISYGQCAGIVFALISVILLTQDRF